MTLVDKVRNAGVVGAGGGGFPAHVKLSSKADTVIANGAECEPLLHKDAAVMEHYAAQIVRGMLLSMEAVGASAGIVGIKGKNKHAVIGGETAAVQAAVEAGAQSANGCLIDQFVIPNVHPDVFVALGARRQWSRPARWAFSSRSTWRR